MQRNVRASVHPDILAQKLKAQRVGLNGDDPRQILPTRFLHRIVPDVGPEFDERHALPEYAEQNLRAKRFVHVVQGQLRRNPLVMRVHHELEFLKIEDEPVDICPRLHEFPAQLPHRIARLLQRKPRHASHEFRRAAVHFHG